MKLQYIASACVLVEHQGARVLCDPWLTDGIYGGAWYHNPPLTVRPEDFQHLDAIYVSHIHPDHFDVATLERLPRVPVVIGNFAQPFLQARLTSLGFPVVVGSAHFGGLSLEIIPADNCDPVACGRLIGCPKLQTPVGTTAQLDTLAVFTGGDHVIVNVNDCPFDLAGAAIERVKAAYDHVDLLLVGYSGAGPWPQCFPNLSEQERTEAAAAKRRRFLQQMTNYVEAFNPKCFLPFAGQYTLGGSLVHLNDQRGVPELEELGGDPRMIKLNRNAWFDCETCEPSEPYKPWPRDAKRRYRKTLASKPLDHEVDPWPTFDELDELVDKAQSAYMERVARKGYAPASNVVIETNWPDGCSIITRVIESNNKRWTTVCIDPRLLKRILTRKAHWNNCEIGSLLQFERVGEYDAAAMFNLSYFHV